MFLYGGEISAMEATPKPILVSSYSCIPLTFNYNFPLFNVDYLRLVLRR